MKKKTEIIFCGIFAIISMIALFTGVGDVGENLDGWHGLSSGHASVFVMICLLFAAGGVFNSINLMKNKISTINILIGILLILCPIILLIISVSLQGNAESDFQYLILRTAQGFDKTYIWLIIFAVAAFPISKIKSKNK